ncbi:MAGUK p55 subfamily member 7-like isoform X1 [Daphnia carinata]|uniref:MAGUK p55 subfamily member 7-like isoform X1 n=1 Tax=Daphnia carinata TaxID=120202 RepID=UPI00257B7741|nr:MAGUK p55 subfamily member 7-like isoform X1 [Daphnia carinata]
MTSLPNEDLSRLLATLHQTRGGDDQKDLNFLSQVLTSKEMTNLLRVHKKISTIVGKPHSPSDSNGTLEYEPEMIVPIVSNVFNISCEVIEILQSFVQRSGSRDSRELILLLQRPAFQSLLLVHDTISQKDYVPKLPEPPFNTVDEDEETIKIVQLVKSNEPLAQTAEPIVGATIKTDERTGKIVIARVMHGGAADRSGLIHPGDEVIEVNGIDVLGKTPNDVLEILQNAEGTITFKLIPSESQRPSRENRVRVRALFDFTAALDRYIPCKEAGLDFRRGDIIHIVSQDDPYWWQARHEGDKQMRAGLIPSRMLQEKRIAYERAHSANNNSDQQGCSPARSIGSLKSERSSPTQKVMYALAENEDFDRQEIATYEEVARLMPYPAVPRPIVLIGPPGVGRNELKRRLIALDPDKFRTTIPYTSRLPKPGEADGVDYHFLDRQQMERDIDDGLFVEFGEYKGNLYGTANRSIKEIIELGYTCILNPHHQALKTLRTAEFKPHVVYIKPPGFNVLRETRSAAYARSTFDENSSRGFTDDELAEMIRSGQRIELHYGHLFDDVIVNGDLSTAFEQLLVVARKLDTQSQWVPVSWVV